MVGNLIMSFDKRIYLLGLLAVLLVSPLILADEVSETISSCGEPTAAFATMDGKYDIHYDGHNIWLKYRLADGEWQWYQAFDDRTTKDLSRDQVVKRLPCSSAILKPKTSPPATPSDVPLSNSISPDTAKSNDSPFILVFVLSLIAFLLWAITTSKGNKYKQAPSPVLAEDRPIECPRCRSHQLHTGPRGWKLLTGFIGSNKVVITCLKCGHKFKPGYGS